MKILFWLSAGGIIYAYIGYPLILGMLTIFRKKPQFNDSQVDFPVATVIIACYNEGSVIREKIENSLALLADYPRGEESEIIIALDGSVDNTADAVRAVSDSRVRLVSLDVRAGKETAQREAVREAKGSFILFTDAKVQLKKDALINFARYFSSPEIGGVSSIDEVVGVGSGEGFYVRYEMWIRKKETAFSSLVGMSGSAFAVRREVCEALRSDIPSDFALLIALRKRGLRGVLAEDIPCYYRSVATTEAEFSRKVRTALRGIATLWKLREVLSVKQYGSFAWQLWSHKVMRWMVPWLLVLSYASLLQIAPGSFLYSALLFGGCALIVSALFGFFRPEFRDHIWVKVPLFFFVSNLAVAVAWVKFLFGHEVTRWQPTDRPTGG